MNWAVVGMFTLWLVALVYGTYQLRKQNQIQAKQCELMYKVTNSKVAVDQDYYWQPMDTCPRGVKVQLLSIGGVAVYGHYLGESDWQGWAPVPKRKPT